MGVEVSVRVFFFCRGPDDLFFTKSKEDLICKTYTTPLSSVNEYNSPIESILLTQIKQYIFAFPQMQKQLHKVSWKLNIVVI